MIIKYNKDNVLCNSLLILFALYLAQPAVGGAGFFGVIILFLICAISLVYLVKCAFSKFEKDVVLILWILFFFYNTLTYLFSERILEYTEFRQLVLNMLPMFAFYQFTQKGILNEKKIKVFFVAMFLLFFISFFNQSSLLSEASGREENINNMSYFIMGLLPFVFLFRRALIISCLLVVLSWLAVISSKRAVLILCMIAILLFLYSFIVRYKGQKKFVGVIFASLIGYVFFLTSVYFYNKFGIGERFEERLLLMIYEGHTSGRDTLFLGLYNAWLNSNEILVYLFGLGYRGALDATGVPTHNDLIKSLGEGGILGLILFLGLMAALGSRWFRSFRKTEHRLAYTMYLCSMLVAVAASRWYGSAFFYMNCVLLPYLLASQKAYYDFKKGVVVGSRSDNLV